MTENPSYAIRDNVDKHRFEADLGDGSLAIAEYLIRDRKILFTHTQVPPAHEGRGVGTALIRFAYKRPGIAVYGWCRFAPFSRLTWTSIRRSRTSSILPNGRHPGFTKAP